MLSFLTISYPAIDPVAFSIGPVSVKWYGLAYMSGLLVGWFYIKKILSTPRLWVGGKAPMAIEKVDDLLLWLVFGVIVGGRLGYVFFYGPLFFLQNPLEIFATWKGGMSFHGALVGCGISIWLFARRHKVNVWSIMDLCAASVPLGLIFGRLANFVNAELWGRTTDVAWGMVFPGREAGPLPRHPSQLYEMVLEGVVLFIVLRIMTHKKLALHRPGLIIGLFLVGYGLARSFSEFFRQPDVGHALNIGPLTAGIVYSIPMIALGIYFIRKAKGRGTDSVVADAGADTKP